MYMIEGFVLGESRRLNLRVFVITSSLLLD